MIDWFAEEARRTYGRVIPARAEGIYQLVVKEPVGPVAAFTPWNFPINQVVRKLSCALAAGCSIIVKAPEETPASPAELIRCFADAGVPAGVMNLVYGVPAEISEYLIPHPIIRKMSFTGSTAVGKQLAAIAGAHMKRVTMELGGHAPAIVFDDADVDTASRLLATAKVSAMPARSACRRRACWCRRRVYDQFVEGFVQHSQGAEGRRRAGSRHQHGADGEPAPHRRDGDVHRRCRATRRDACRPAAAASATRAISSSRRCITDVPKDARVMNEEPFGPLAVISPFSAFDEVVTEANRLPYGLASYAYTRSAKTANAIAAAVESGMISINHHGLALPEVPFGGVKDSGYGSEGGLEAIEGYLEHQVRHPGGLVAGRGGDGRLSAARSRDMRCTVSSVAMPGRHGVLPCRRRTIAARLRCRRSLVVRADRHRSTCRDRARRTKIWEFNTNLHCSIIGTCLSTGELRQVLKKLGVAPPDSTDHELHGAAVSLAGRHDKAAKLLHKALDERHRVAINQFAKATTEDARACAVARRGAAWRDTGRLLGDADASGRDAAAVIRDAFGEVHMLSHLVGAANRADIRRLCELEADNAELRARLERQQGALRDAVVTRDARIQELRQALAQRIARRAVRPPADDSAVLRQLVPTSNAAWRARRGAVPRWKKAGRRHCRARRGAVGTRAGGTGSARRCATNWI